MIYELKALGMVCPFPLLEAKEKMAELVKGDQLKIEFDCTQATEAIPKWAAESGFAVSDYEQVGNAAWSITITK